jgi:transcriptional antiterminator NusG
VNTSLDPIPDHTPQPGDEPPARDAPPAADAAADQADQPSAFEAESPAESKQPAAKPTKKLASGRAAFAIAGARQSTGVATSKALLTPTRRSSAHPAAAPPESAPPPPSTEEAAPAVEGEDAERQFDPAADLPMYREGMNWFVLRVASNKENYVRDTLLKKVQIEGMQHLVGRIMVPTEKTKTLKGGKQRITETKLYPGYVFVEMKLEPDGRIPQDVFFLIKETTGVGDFVGTAGRPTPMATPEVEKMLFDSRRPEETPIVKMEFVKGDHVTIKEGPFQSYEGTVDEVLPDKGLVRVLVTIFGRQAPIELEYWQIAKVTE